MLLARVQLRRLDEIVDQFGVEQIVLLDQVIGRVFAPFGGAEPPVAALGRNHRFGPGAGRAGHHPRPQRELLLQIDHLHFGDLARQVGAVGLVVRRRPVRRDIARRQRLPEAPGGFEEAVDEFVGRVERSLHMSLLAVRSV
jgi:hypothetical protein